MTTPSYRSALDSEYLGSVHQTMGTSQQSHVTKSDLLSHRISGVIDSLFYDQRAPVTSQSKTYSHSIYEDVVFDEVPQGSVAYGQEIVFKFGQSGSPLLQGLELIAKWPVAHGTHVLPAVAANDDEWVPFLGYAVLGKTDGRPVTIRYQGSVIRELDPVQLYLEQFLASHVSTNEYDSLVARVGADATIRAISTCTELPISVCRMNDMAMQLAVCALPEALELRFTLPSYGDLVRQWQESAAVFTGTDNTLAYTAPTAANRTIPAAPTLSLRCHYVEIAAMERAQHAASALGEASIQRAVLDVEVLSNVVATSQVAAATADSRADTLVDITRFTRPSRFLAAVARWARDLEFPSGHLAAAYDNNDLAEMRAVNPRPDFFRLLPIASWYLQENGRQRGTFFTLDNFTKTHAEKHGLMCELDILRTVAIVPFNRDLFSRNGVGSVTPSNLQTGRLVLSIQADGTHPSADDSRTFLAINREIDLVGGARAPSGYSLPTFVAGVLAKRIDVYSFARNVQIQTNGKLLIKYR